MTILFLFILGLFIGSFLNVLIDRLPHEESVVFPSSHCDTCKKKLLWYDLIPVVSFIFLRGCCRYCHCAISIQYPIVELLTGGFFVLSFLYVPHTHLLLLIYNLFFVSSLIVIFFTDLKYGIIPDAIVFFGVVVSFLYLIFQHPNVFISSLLSAAGAFAFFLAIFLVTRGRGMGFGDVKLSILLGLFFGFPNIIFVLYIAFLTGAFFSIILVLGGKKKLKETIVFGPFLVIGSLLVLYIGHYLTRIWFLPI